jgi:broad specificity phosphatase PhoE
MERTVYLVRHGHREDFIGDTVQYNVKWAESAIIVFDPSLSDLGKRQAEDLAKKLKNKNIDYLFSSPFMRTLETAFIIAQYTALKVKIESGLSEWLNPVWFSYKPQLADNFTIENKFNGWIDTTYNSLVSPYYPEISERLQVQTRVSKTIRLLLAKFRGNLCLVGHGASITAAAITLGGEGVIIQTGLCRLIAFSLINNQWKLISDGSEMAE